MSITSFDVLKAMVDQDNKGITLSPLNNLIRAQKNRHGTDVTIGVGADVVGGIMRGDFVGGLILADKAEFNKTKRKLEIFAARDAITDGLPVPEVSPCNCTLAAEGRACDCQL